MKDGLVYDEQPTWHHPVRHRLGAALLADGRPAEARTVDERFRRAWQASMSC